MEPLLLIAAIATLALAALVRLGRPDKKRGRATARPHRYSQSAAPSRSYPGDFTGRFAVEYSPSLDGAPDPGEVVWTWVPFEEDYSRGKDRPVLLVGRDGHWLLGLQLSSQDHSNAATARGHHGQTWVAIGSGPWDSRRRPSAVRLDRVVRVDPASVRREGAILDRSRFNTVVHSLEGL